MSMICKIFGHKQAKNEPLKHTGWSCVWNSHFTHHMVGYHCKRCYKHVEVGFVSTIEEGKLDVQDS